MAVREGATVLGPAGHGEHVVGLERRQAHVNKAVHNFIRAIVEDRRLRRLRTCTAKVGTPRCRWRTEPGSTLRTTAT